MNKFPNLENLKKIGLTSSEIAVYSAGLNLGPSEISKIAKESGFSRPFVYTVLDSLEEKGFIRRISKKRGTMIIMTPLENLEIILDQKKQEIDGIKLELMDICKEYELKKVSSKFAPMSFTRGVQGIKNLILETLKSESGHVLVLAPIDLMTAKLGEKFLKYWVDEGDKKMILRNSIWSKPIEETSFQRVGLRKMRIAPKYFNVNNAFLIYDDNVSIISLSDNGFAFSVKNREFSETMTSFFETLWEASSLED